MKTHDRGADALSLARRLGILSASEARSRGIHPQQLSRLCRRGELDRIVRGLYRLPDADVSEHATLAAASKRFPKAIVCLLSALRFHDIGTQNPREVWMALRRGSAVPRASKLPVRFLVFSEEAFDVGVENHVLDKIAVKVTCPAKTIADCFKYRNKIGVDVAVEALQEAFRKRQCTVDEIWTYAKVSRTTSVMRPYLEAVQ